MLDGQGAGEGRSWLMPIVLATAAVHLALLLRDIFVAEPFMHADRAKFRMRAIEGFVEALGRGGDAVVDYLATHGIVGDYAFHALAWLAGGRMAVVLLQASMMVLAVALLYRAVELLTRSHRLAAAATLIYALLPHNLAFPHQLLTESLSNPLVVYSFYFTVVFVRQRERGLWPLLAAGVLLGLSITIRPLWVAWPLVCAALLVLYLRREGAVPAAAFVATAWLPLLLWMSFIATATGHFSMGESQHNLQRNLGRFVWTVLQADRRAAAREAEAHGGEFPSHMSLATYLDYLGRYPMLFARGYANNSVVFLVESGMTRFSMDYLQVGLEDRAALRDPQTGWRARMAKEGFSAGLVLEFASRFWLQFTISLVAALLFLVLIALALAGTVRALWCAISRCASRDSLLLWTILALLPPYVFLSMFIIGYGSSRHRSPAEFAIVLLALLGAAAMGDVLRARRNARAGAAQPAEGAAGT